MTAIAGVLRDAWSYETSNDPDNWNANNPSWGQCAVTALVIQDLFGGDLIAGWHSGIRHYWNRLPDGTVLDVSVEQFGKDPFYRAIEGTKTREYVLSNQSTRERYELLKQRVVERLRG